MNLYQSVDWVVYLLEVEFMNEIEVQEFERKCIFCKKEIIMRETKFGWRAYEKDNKKHNCRRLGR